MLWFLLYNFLYLNIFLYKLFLFHLFFLLFLYITKSGILVSFIVFTCIGWFSVFFLFFYISIKNVVFYLSSVFLLVLFCTEISMYEIKLYVIFVAMSCVCLIFSHLLSFHLFLRLFRFLLK